MIPVKIDEQILIVNSTPEYADQMAALQLAVYGVEDEECCDCLRAAHFLNHMKVFPEAQFIAIDRQTGLVVGMTSGMRLRFDPAQPTLKSWAEITDHGTLSTHDPHGEWMYGVESAVHPDYQGQGVGGRLMDARAAVVRRLNLRGIVAGSVIRDYHTVAQQVTPQQYLEEVIAGLRWDSNLSKQMRKGFRPLYLIPNYVTDESSLGWGAAIVWHNPDYRADLPMAG